MCVVRYEDTKTSLAHAEVRLTMLTERFNSAESTLNDRLNQWKDQVQAIATRLSERFEAYMGELQFSGNVVFEQRGALMDHEMQMYVSFRENRDSQKLSGMSHSGGERAVSTVMYLMALQELTSSPFRVVDEINQVGRCSNSCVRIVQCTQKSLLYE
jgi:structural maintenance of chromosomes protein 5